MEIHAWQFLLSLIVLRDMRLGQDQDIMIRTWRLQVDRIILQDRVDQMIIMTDPMITLIVQQEQLVTDQTIIMAIRMQLIAEQWEWPMDHLTLIRLRMYLIKYKLSTKPTAKVVIVF